MTNLVRDKRLMVAGMTPTLREGRFIFCITSDQSLIAKAMRDATAFFQEDEGTAFILPFDKAASLGFDVSMPMRRIVLEVFSALDGVGLTAAVSNALADANISCNMVSAFHHDNVFVPAADADRAVSILLKLQTSARTE